ncbi:MAG: hypothetical protein GX432_04605 [Candidatus Atribacteria bacterium]|nr:hypothetical protein [Candidatus Atribacteria bacterium]
MKEKEFVPSPLMGEGEDEGGFFKIVHASRYFLEPIEDENPRFDMLVIFAT